MQTYVSILRGINVSGHKMIRMETLRGMYEDLKFKNVKTYIQSGNVIFRAKRTESGDLEKKIAKKILEETGFEVPVIVKELDELNDILNNNPFLKKRKEDPAKLHVTFLSGPAEKSALDKIREGQYGKDEYIVSGNAIYLFCPDGYGNTKLSNNFFEAKLKLTATTRNWKTIGELYRIGQETASVD